MRSSRWPMPPTPGCCSRSPDPPALLYCRGPAPSCSAGLRSRWSAAATRPRQGARNAEQFARSFSAAGLTIVSGLALGIDAAAHRGGLAGEGSTIAVLGTGVDIVYPRRTRRWPAEIAERGLLLSEFPLGSQALAHNFPRRNRADQRPGAGLPGRRGGARLRAR